MSNSSDCILLCAEHKSVLSNFLTTCYVHDKDLNIIFICKDNVHVGVHQCILISVSDFLKKVIQTSNNEITYISLPDVESSNFKLLVNFLYNGAAKVNERQLGNLNDLLCFLDIRITNCEIIPCATVTRKKFESNKVVKVLTSASKQLSHYLQENKNTEGTQIPTGTLNTSDRNLTSTGSDEDIFINKELPESTQVNSSAHTLENSSLLDGNRQFYPLQSLAVLTNEVPRRFSNFPKSGNNDTLVVKISEVRSINDGHSSDVTSHVPHSSFISNEESCSIDNYEEVYSVSSDEDASDSNEVRVENDAHMNDLSSENVCANTSQQREDPYSQYLQYVSAHRNEEQTSQLSNTNNKETLLNEEHIQKVADDLEISKFSLIRWFRYQESKNKPNNENSKKKVHLRKKVYISREQKSVLEEVYKKNKYLNNELREKLVEVLQLSRSKLGNWFGWRRYKDQLAQRSPNIQCNKTRKRKFLSDEQTLTLREVYEKTKYVSDEVSQELSQSLGISTSTVKKWFFNQRYKDITLQSGNTSVQEQSSSFTTSEEPQYIDVSSDDSGEEFNTSNDMCEEVGYASSQQAEDCFQNNGCTSNAVSGEGRSMEENETLFNEEQLHILNQKFEENKHPPLSNILDIAEQINVSGDDVMLWFNKKNTAQERTAIGSSRQKPFQLNEYQKTVLRGMYMQTKYLSKEDTEELTASLGIPRATLLRWFERRRAEERSGKQNINVENNVMTGKKILSTQQKLMLEDVYKTTKYLHSEELITELEDKVGLSRRVLLRWFSKKREKDKRRLRRAMFKSQNGGTVISHNEESRSSDISVVVEYDSCNEEFDTSNQEQEIYIKCLSSENVYVDTLDVHGAADCKENKTSNIVSGTSNAVLQEKVTVKEESPDIDKSKILSPSISNEESYLNEMVMRVDGNSSFSSLVHQAALQEKVGKHVTPDVSGISSNDTVPMVGASVSSSMSYKPETPNQNDDTSAIPLSDDTDDDNDDEDVMVITDDEQECNLMDQRSIVNENILYNTDNQQSLAVLINANETSVQEVGTKTKRSEHRKFFTEKQYELLSEVYKKTKSPDDDLYEELSKQLNEPVRRIYNWFSRRRYLEREGEQNMNVEKNVDNEKQILSLEQRLMLEDVYKATKYLHSDELIFELEDRVGLPRKVILRWFSKKREREKKRLDRLLANPRNIRGVSPTRVYLSEQQRTILENVFSETRYLSDELKAKLSATTGIPTKILLQWFCKKRLREKKKLEETAENFSDDLKVASESTDLIMEADTSAVDPLPGCSFD